MRIATVRQDRGHHAAAFVVADRVVLAAAAADLLGHPSDGLIDVRALLDRGPERVAELFDAAERLAGAEDDPMAVGSVSFAVSVLAPEKIICVGMNFRDHAAEASMEIPAAPPLFGVFRNALIGPDEPVVLSPISDQIDWEGEIAIVIGATARDVTVDAAPAYIAGLTVFNDVTARDLQLQTSQWFGGKGIDTFAPVGPSVVSLDELGDLNALRIITRVNGAIVQDSTTAEMVWSFAELVAYVSTIVTLRPGDLIATGTPAGVGFLREPQQFLVDGDVVEVEVPGIGVLSNPIVARADGEPVGPITATA
jgi:acylpyruvate hydrolase